MIFTINFFFADLYQMNRLNWANTEEWSKQQIVIIIIKIKWCISLE